MDVVTHWVNLSETTEMEGCEVMPRMIDADALLDIVEQQGYVTVDDIINAETIEAEPVKHGRWVPVKLTRRTTEYKCSICGRWERTDKEPYCNCGAKMDGGIDRDN